MTDRELLERAAKAAQIDVLWHEGRYKNVTGFAPEMNLYAAKDWNPLTDDGDALRLAVTLALTVQAACVDEYDRTYTRVDHFPNTGGPATVNTQEFGEDQYAATRRAIVRAAAEIGKAMP